MLRHKIFSIAVAGVVLTATAAPIGILAQTTNIQETIARLLQQIQNIQAQIQQLQTQRQAAVADLVRTLREGTTGDDVKILQSVLAADPEIYPEGLITGYFGRLTAQAVRRYQAKHGIETVGAVGPKTLRKLNEDLQSSPVTLEDSAEGKRPCAIVPPGHLIAPGWLRKMGGVQPIVPACQTLPPGIAQKLTGTGTTTPPAPPPSTDTIPPYISNVVTTNVASTSAMVSWDTSELATSKVYYAATTSLNIGLATVVSDATLVLHHSVNLTGLTRNTFYSYLVESTDPSGNVSTSTPQTFNTLL
ncbi:MAG: peptidoglycan-binding protein [Candidatus Sungbacteria bacterium]|uniref:Peptidoglycan-binding protein n=1 Tax=Candidatus Sungiibacteriota bacterium TaxID=2750080 RepID=A0A932YWC6_9BACT|nr:peptidoglycan-binding protein [Candidatus Sungbacteria bacterium]